MKKIALPMVAMLFALAWPAIGSAEKNYVDARVSIINLGVGLERFSQEITDCRVKSKKIEKCIKNYYRSYTRHFFEDAFADLASAENYHTVKGDECVASIQTLTNELMRYEKALKIDVAHLRWFEKSNEALKKLDKYLEVLDCPDESSLIIYSPGVKYDAFGVFHRPRYLARTAHAFLTKLKWLDGENVEGGEGIWDYSDRYVGWKKLKVEFGLFEPTVCSQIRLYRQIVILPVNPDHNKF